MWFLLRRAQLGLTVSPMRPFWRLPCDDVQSGAGGRLGRDSGNLSCCFAICSPLASTGFTLLALLYFTGPGNPRPMRPRFTERRDAPRLRPKMGNAQPEREWHILGELHRAEKEYVGARVAGAKFDSGHIKGHLTLGSEVPDAPEPERPPRTRGFWRLVSAHRSAKAALDQTTCVAGTACPLLQRDSHSEPAFRVNRCFTFGARK